MDETHTQHIPASFRRERVEAELDAEVNSYFDTLAERHMERGMSPEEARRAARVQFEGPEQVKEKVREVRVGTIIDATLKDVRYALRILRKNPGFLAVAVCSLAIGLGATSAIYSIATPCCCVRFPSRMQAKSSQ